jgi:simple sugar transport system ATP-binding protein
MVHQHFMLVPSMTVAENVCLGLPSAGRVFPDVNRVARELAELSERHGLDLDPRAKVERLSVGQQQRVEIVKALYRQARILILDEPTAVLTPGEADSLLAVLKSLAAQGTGVVFISHKLREVMAVADRVTVLRRGRLVGARATAGTTAAELAALMVGREVRVREHTPRPAPSGEPVLEISGAGLVDRRGVVRLNDVDLQVGAGEILGVAGVDGNGQRELTRAVCGLQRLTRGRIRIHGTDVTTDSAARRIAAGLAHVPEDRQHTGLVLDLSIADNAALEVMAREPVSRRGWLRPKAMRAAAEQLIRDYDIRCSGPDQPVRELSGGQPAEGTAGPRGGPRTGGPGGLAAHPGTGHRCYRIRARAVAGAARPGVRGAAGLHRTRRDPRTLRPGRRALRRPGDVGDRPCGRPAGRAGPAHGGPAGRRDDTVRPDSDARTHHPARPDGTVRPDGG